MNAKIIYNQKRFTPLCRKAWCNGCSLCGRILTLAYKKKSNNQDGRVHASFDLDRKIYDEYLNGRITKTICEAKNLNKLLQTRDMALELGLVENQDFGMINDACLTELIPKWVDENGRRTLNSRNLI